MRDFDQFLRQACPSLDLEWRRYRRRAARHRVDQRLAELGLPDYAAYLDRLRADPAEAGALADRMRVTISRFYRDRECWRGFERAVLPALVAHLGDTPLSAWSVGCCGGEEPYSLAMLWLERVAPANPGASIEILATDIDEPSLARARRGLYGEGELRELPPELRRSFSPEGGLFRLSERVRGLVRLRRHNLMRDPLPGDLDLILCRYFAFTYYTGERRLEAANRLWSALRPGGALMVGAKEQLGPEELELFEPWSGAPCAFRRRPCPAEVESADARPGRAAPSPEAHQPRSHHADQLRGQGTNERDGGGLGDGARLRSAQADGGDLV